jgi:hemoglobin
MMLMLRRSLLMTTLACCILSCIGCSIDGDLGTRDIKKPPDPPRPLYERLGDGEGISKLVDDWAPRLLNNRRLNFTRAGTPREWQPTPANVDRVKQMLALLISQATGGPEPYTGRDMKSVHQGMKISGYEFDLMKRELKESLKKLKVKDEDQRDLLKVIERWRMDIVEVP